MMWAAVILQASTATFININHHHFHRQRHQQSGASEANARRFISQANQNLELALSNYFEQGIEPETVPPPVAPPVRLCCWKGVEVG